MNRNYKFNSAIKEMLLCFMEKKENNFVEVSEEFYKSVSLNENAKQTKEIKNKLHYYIKPLVKMELFFDKFKSKKVLYNVIKEELIICISGSTSILKNIKSYEPYLKMYAIMLNSLGFSCEKERLIIFFSDWNKASYNLDNVYPEEPIGELNFLSEEELKSEKDYLKTLLENESLNQIKRNEFAIINKKDKSVIKILDSLEDSKEFIKFYKLSETYTIEQKEIIEHEQAYNDLFLER